MVLGGLINRGGRAYNRTEKVFQKRLHSSADENTFGIFLLFQASIHRKILNSFHYKLEGAYIWGGGGPYNWMTVFLVYR